MGVFRIHLQLRIIRLPAALPYHEPHLYTKLAMYNSDLKGKTHGR